MACGPGAPCGGRPCHAGLALEIGDDPDGRAPVTFRYLGLKHTRF
jgi:hypothetical protein